MSEIATSTCVYCGCPQSPTFEQQTSIDSSVVEYLNTSGRIAPVPLPNFNEHRDCFLSSWHCGQPPCIDEDSTQSPPITPISKVSQPIVKCHRVNEVQLSEESTSTSTEERIRIATNPRVKRTSMSSDLNPSSSYLLSSFDKSAPIDSK